MSLPNYVIERSRLRAITILIFGTALVYLCPQFAYELIINTDNISEIGNSGYGYRRIDAPIMLVVSIAGLVGGVILGLCLIISAIRTLKSRVVICINSDGFFDKRYLKKPLPWSEIEKIEFRKIGSANIISHAKFRIYAKDVELYMTTSATLITTAILAREMNTLDIGAMGFKNKEFAEILALYAKLIEV